MQPEKEMEFVREHWVAEVPPSYLADRIIAHALSQKQHVPFMTRVIRAFTLPEQRRFTMAGMAVAACIMIAIVALQNPLSAKTQATGYQPPLDQIADEMMWNDYAY